MKKLWLFFVLAIALVVGGCGPTYKEVRENNLDVGQNGLLVIMVEGVDVSTSRDTGQEGENTVDAKADTALSRSGATAAISAKDMVLEAIENAFKPKTVTPQATNTSDDSASTGGSGDSGDTDDDADQGDTDGSGPVAVGKKIKAYDYVGATNDGRPTWRIIGALKKGQRFSFKAGPVTGSGIAKARKGGIGWDSDELVVKNSHDHGGTIAILIPAKYRGKYKAGDCYIILE